MAVDVWYNLLWFLLPVAAASGWYAARQKYYSETENRPARRRAFSPDYIRGLKHLLDEQPDKAIDVFVNMIEVESETVETHLALGNLFRRRGEVARAIRIHQNLVERANLDDEQRGIVILELGLDYMRSGLLDRAESLFHQLLELRAHRGRALKQLVEIYQQEQEWEKAIEYASRFEQVAPADMRQSIAQYYCQLAEQKVAGGDENACYDLIKTALAVDRNCVRASLIDSRLRKKAGEFKKAINALQRIESQDADFLTEALAPLLACYQAQGNVGEFIDYLDNLSTRRTVILPLPVLFELLNSERGKAVAKRLLEEELKQRPSARGLERLIHYLLRDCGQHGHEQDLKVLQVYAEKIASAEFYRCAHCGFKAKLLHWQCPACKAWVTIKPVVETEYG